MRYSIPATELLSSRKRYWAAMIFVFLIGIVNEVYIHAETFDFFLGILTVSLCATWLHLTKANLILRISYIISAIAMVFFSKGLSLIVDYGDAISDSDTAKSIFTALFFGLIAFGWLVTVYSLVRKRE